DDAASPSPHALDDLDAFNALDDLDALNALNALDDLDARYLIPPTSPHASIP
ncbi:hypothetical protein E4U54_005920, partial [Claviceps lovelessii]